MTKTTQQTAIQLAARHLVETQSQMGLLSKQIAAGMGGCAGTLASVCSNLNVIGQALEAAGATAPAEEYQGTPPPAPDSLEALRRIEGSRTEASMLLVNLWHALKSAEELDRARGDWVGDQADIAHGETPGTNYAEAIQALVLRLQGELGAEGSGRE